MSTPYHLADERGSRALEATIRALTERANSLRAQGKLTQETLLHYYGETRFEQIAESNALEGSTLSVGETELAVLKGITISGHDPAYSRDAQALARALDEMTRMAKDRTPTDIEQVRRLHGLILGDRPGSGTFRTGEVRIRGARHVSPRNWREVMDQMEQWQEWSRANAAAPPLLRASVLHAWLEHVHPFVDGNGRVGRAVTNLELIRFGYPPVILRREDRDQYLDALSRSDEGDLGTFVDLIAGRLEDSLRDLERAAQRRPEDGLDSENRQSQIAQLELWKAGVHLLFTSIRASLTERFKGGGVELHMREYDSLSVDNFIELCEGRAVRVSWAFTIRCKAPDGPGVERLAWAGVMEDVLRQQFAGQPGRPALMWSAPNPGGYPPWVRLGKESPGGEQMAIHGDSWLVVRDGRVVEYSPSQLAERIAEDISELIPPQTIL
jgi:Fic family protein